MQTSSSPDDKAAELEGILDEVSYALTSARTAGLDRTDELRAALRKARNLVADADALAVSVSVERGKSRD
jgi:hypothetical protein